VLAGAVSDTERCPSGPTNRRLRGTLPGVLVVCPKCGADRRIPLTFGGYRRKDRYLGQADRPERPVAKCPACGERTYVSVQVHRSLSSD
jgi:predicted RNA-binding Zn-ribbon protein involved in translation (DUF1610 family)